MDAKSNTRLVTPPAAPIAVDANALGAAIDAVLAAKSDLVARYRSGETKLFGVLMGEVMRATSSKANAKVAGDVLRAKLG